MSPELLQTAAFGPPSRLYHLEPIGIGTSGVEGLTGYIGRLAYEHCVAPGTLVLRELAPALGRPRVAYPDNRDFFEFFNRFLQTGDQATGTLNGVARSTREWVDVLERLTLRQDLRHLTLLAWAEVLSDKRLLRSSRAYCPACYRDWRTEGRAAYDPLLWALRPVTVCLRHRRTLREHCPHDGCRRTLPHLAQQSWPGQCPHCSRALDDEADVAAHGERPTSEQDWCGRAWVTEQVGEMLASSPSLQALPGAQGIAASVSRCIEQAAQCDTGQFARMLEMPEATVWAWQAGAVMPGLPSILLMCQAAGVSLVSFLCGQSPLAIAPSPAMLKRETVRRLPVRRASVRKALKAAATSLEPPSLANVAAQVGHRAVVLRRVFPDECLSIKTRHAKWRQQQAVARDTAARQAIETTVRQLLADGVRPGRKRVQRLLPPGVSLQSTRYRTYWHAALQTVRSADSHADIPGTNGQATTTELDFGDLKTEKRPSGSALRWREFTQARAFARSLQLTNSADWFAWSRGVSRPADVPIHPEHQYRGGGWAGWDDWLGLGWMPFDLARQKVRALKLRTREQFYAWSLSGGRPVDIPSNPNITYRDQGWIGWGDWLGSGHRPRCAPWRPFDEARSFVRALALPTQDAWVAWTTTTDRPADIPSNPRVVYRDQGWTGMGDWLGTVPRPLTRSAFRSFPEARAFVRSLGLTTQKAWTAWATSDARPVDIPGTPARTYRDRGWVNLGDWLGTNHGVGRPLGSAQAWLPFEEARAVVQGLRLRNREAWKAWLRTGARPTNIPFSPNIVYRDLGWAGWADWLTQPSKQIGPLWCSMLPKKRVWQALAVSESRHSVAETAKGWGH